MVPRASHMLNTCSTTETTFPTPGFSIEYVIFVEHSSWTGQEVWNWEEVVRSKPCFFLSSLKYTSPWAILIGSTAWIINNHIYYNFSFELAFTVFSSPMLSYLSMNREKYVVLHEECKLYSSNRTSPNWEFKELWKPVHVQIWFQVQFGIVKF